MAYSTSSPFRVTNGRGVVTVLNVPFGVSISKPTMDGRTEIYVTPLELLDRLAQLITPPRIHKHRYCGVLAPNAKLRRAVIESAGPAGATLQLLQEAQQAMGLEDAGSSEEERKSRLGRAAARCWACY